jgi:hypothetical protein
MHTFAVSACRMFQPNSGHSPEGLFTEMPRRGLLGNSVAGSESFRKLHSDGRIFIQ